MDANGHHLVLDAANTVITFEVRWFGVIPVRGTFRRLHGTLEFENHEVTSARVRIDVDAASVRTGLGLRDLHLRGPRFLHSDLHPYISFKSTAVRREAGRLVVDGVLSLRGVEVPVHSVCPLDGADGPGTTVELCGQLALSRRQFGIGVARGAAAGDPFYFATAPLFLAIADTVRVSVRVALKAVDRVVGLSGRRVEGRA